MKTLAGIMLATAFAAFLLLPGRIGEASPPAILAAAAAPLNSADIQPIRKDTVVLTQGWLADNTSSASKTVEVFLTGKEQAIVERFVKKVDEPVHDRFPNALDHALAVLLAKSYPKPDVTRLARATVESLCREFERQTNGKTATAQQETWVSAVSQTGSFDSILKEFVSLAPATTDQNRLIDAGLNGILTNAGWVLSKDQIEDVKRMAKARETATEERGFVGLRLHRWPVVELVSGGPAADAGVRNGDVVVAVNGKGVAEASTTQDALKILQGPVGSVARLTVKRDGMMLTFDVTRAGSAVRVEARQIEPHVLLITLPTFEGAGIADRVKRMIQGRTNDQRAVIVFDLRDNVGGRPEEANAVADMFLDGRLLQILAFRDGRLVAFTSHPGARTAARLILLMNRNSASGAEMLAMALRDNSKATLVGEETAGALFGKDMAELVGGKTIFFRTEPTVLSITGRDYSTTGIPPDIQVRDSRSKEKDDILLRALELAKQPVSYIPERQSR
ncbi:MAG: PDZ domain-containing protein [Verrucomicrobia bacterium]|nr:PDZ domain-containing protein [Verrucomicrobiota bacterium]